MTIRTRNVRHDAYRRLTMDPGTPTASYSSIHAALAATAEHHGLAPSDVRVLLAIHDLGGRASSAQLEAALMMHDSGVRRALLTLYGRRMASRKDPRPHVGVNEDVRLLARGEQVVAAFHRFLYELHTHPDEPDEFAVQASEKVDRLDTPAGAPA